MTRSNKRQMLFKTKRRRRHPALLVTALFWLLWVPLSFSHPIAEGTTVTAGENLLVGLLLYLLGSVLWVTSRWRRHDPVHISQNTYDRGGFADRSW